MWKFHKFRRQESSGDQRVKLAVLTGVISRYDISLPIMSYVKV